jgi:transcriptional regulator
MYVPAAFKTDDATAWSFVAERGFGTLIAVDGDRPVASHLPLLVREGAGERCIACHVARANPLHRVIAAQPHVLLTVLGPDAYISPDWYVSADQVPTWNYVSVHLYGTARVQPETDALAHVDALSAVFEARLAPKKPWTPSKMTPARREAMLKVIVPLEIRVERIEAQWKLGQHKSPADKASVLAALGRSDKAGALALAEVIARRNPA